MWARPQRQSIAMLTSDGSQHGVVIFFCFVSTEKSSALRLGLCGHCVWQAGCCMLLLNSCTWTGNPAACLSISLFICACVHMHVDTEAREQPCLLSSGAPFGSFETVSYWPRAPCLGEASWPASPRSLPSPAFHSAVCATVPSIFTWALGITLVLGAKEHAGPRVWSHMCYWLSLPSLPLGLHQSGIAGWRGMHDFGSNRS